MTLEEIEALKAPEQRPEGVDFESYTHLCVRAGVEGISKSGWDSLPILAKADTEDYDLKKDDQGLEDDEDNVGDGGSPESVGDESEAATDEAIGEDEEEEGMTDSEKSLIGTSDLMKAIEAYGDVEDALESVEPQSRESYLHARLDAGTISKSEQTELGRIWSNEEEPSEEPMRKSLVETLSEDEGSGQLVDASDFLRNLVKGVDTRMDQVLGAVGRDGRATRELLKATGSLIKSLASHAEQQDALIKAMNDRMEHLESTPAPRRAVTGRRESVAPRQLTKSAVGGADNSLSKAQITDALRALMIHASEKEDSSAMDRIAHATSLYEQTGTLPKTMVAAVQQVSN